MTTALESYSVQSMPKVVNRYTFENIGIMKLAPRLCGGTTLKDASAEADT
jgi:hypothetical protein